MPKTLLELDDYEEERLQDVLLAGLYSVLDDYDAIPRHKRDMVIVTGKVLGFLAERAEDDNDEDEPIPM